MKTHYIHAKINVDVTLPEEALKELEGKKIAVVSNVQHLHTIRKVMEQLPDSIFGGQVLGCRAENAKRLNDQVDCFLYVGTGYFHPIKVGMETDKPVYCFDPCSPKFEQLEPERIETYKKKKTGSLLKFYNSQKIGILVTTKIGQNDNKIGNADNKMLAAKKLIARNDGKEYYVFAFDTLRPNDLEDFNFIDCWVNTACSRIADEKKDMVNSDEIFEHEATQSSSETKNSPIHVQVRKTLR